MNMGIWSTSYCKDGVDDDLKDPHEDDDDKIDRVFELILSKKCQ